MSGYVCTMCEDPGREVVMLITSLADGKTVASCADDLPVAFVGGLATELGVDPQRLYDAVKRFTDREIKRQAAAAAADGAAAEHQADQDGQQAALEASLEGS